LKYPTRPESAVEVISVLDTKSQNIPEVVVARHGAGGVPGIWEGWVNWVKGSKRGQFTSYLRGRRTIPVTSGGSQVSGKGHKGGGKGGSRGSKGNCAMYICKRDMCARVIELLE
jgi:hypothetical protein